MNKKVKRKIVIIFIIILFINFYILPSEIFAAEPALISKLKGAFEKIEGYIDRKSVV